MTPAQSIYLKYMETQEEIEATKQELFDLYGSLELVAATTRKNTSDPFAVKMAAVLLAIAPIKQKILEIEQVIPQLQQRSNTTWMAYYQLEFCGGEPSALAKLVNDYRTCFETEEDETVKEVYAQILSCLKMENRVALLKLKIKTVQRILDLKRGDPVIYTSKLAIYQQALKAVQEATSEPE